MFREKIKKTTLILSLLVMMTGWQAVLQAQETTTANATQPDNQAQLDQEREKIFNRSLPEEKADSIRAIQEGLFMVLERYSMIDTVLVSEELGRDYGSSLWIGSCSVVPGVGELANKSYFQGDSMLFLTALNWQTLREVAPREEEGPVTVYDRCSEAFGFCKWTLQSFATMDAGYTAMASDPTYDRALWIGASSMIPGVGQFINHDWWKGGSLLLGFIISDRLQDLFTEQAKKEKRNIVTGHQEQDLQFSFNFLPGGFMAGMTRKF